MNARTSLLPLWLIGATACVGGGNATGGVDGGVGSLGPGDGSSGSGGDASGVVAPGSDSGGPAGGADATVACITGTLCKDGQCHDLASDDANCGACGTACAAGQVCSAGACAATCGSGLVQCGSSCVDPKTSTTHCGASAGCTGASAGVACPTGQPCVSGVCASLCGSSTSASIQICNGVCTDTAFDANNCGGCGKVCTASNANTSCGNGVCGTICKAGYGDCDGDPSNGCEENLETSTANCGGCGQACSLGPCSGGTCAPDPEWSSGPLVGDFPDAAAYVVEHGGALFGANGDPIDAGLGTIADAAINPGAGGAFVDAATCAIDDAGKISIGTSACADGGACDDVVYDRTTGLLWQRFPSASSSSLYDAQCYCASLSLAGLPGWRLPTRLELMTLVDLSRVSPALNPGAFPNPSIPTNALGYCMSSSVSKPVLPTPYAYEVGLTGGDLFEWGAGGGQSNLNQIRCVR